MSIVQAACRALLSYEEQETARLEAGIAAAEVHTCCSLYDDNPEEFYYLKLREAFLKSANTNPAHYRPSYKIFTWRCSEERQAVSCGMGIAPFHLRPVMLVCCCNVLHVSSSYLIQMSMDIWEGSHSAN